MPISIAEGSVLVSRGERRERHRFEQNRPVIQHVISEWLLRAFARQGTLGQYDKATDTFDSTSPGAFLVELNAHSVVVEHAIQSIETPAAQAGLRLGKAFRNRPPGLYAMMDDQGPASAVGEEVRAVGVVADTRILIPNFHAPWTTPTDPRSLARYLGLMYQRSPKLEEAMRQWGLAFDRAAQPVLDQIVPGMRTGLETLLQTARARMIPRALRIGEVLETANWFVVRSPDDESFVLSDCPVNATIALGHDDGWRAIFTGEAFAITMAIGPKIALLVAPHLIPISGIETRDLTKAINRIAWRSADRYVLARDRGTLAAVAPELAMRRLTVAVEVDPNLDAKAVATVMDVLRQAMRRVFAAQMRLEANTWTHWDGCRLVIGQVAEGRRSASAATRNAPNATSKASLSS
jgi:hypothetical protein